MSPITTCIAATSAGWQLMAGLLLVSGLAVLSVCQDLGLRTRMGAVFSSLIALAFGISALNTAIVSNLRFAPAICVVVLCAEALLVLRWAMKRNSQ